jgi:hypothetical protein
VYSERGAGKGIRDKISAAVDKIFLFSAEKEYFF